MTGLRPAREGDIPALAAMERAFFPDAPAEDWLLRMLRDGRHVFLLWEEEGSLLGYAWYEFHPTLLNDRMVFEFGSGPWERGGGIGATKEVRLDRVEISRCD